MTGATAERVTAPDLAALRAASVVVTGAEGMLGAALCETLRELVPTCGVVAPRRAALDVRDRDAVLRLRHASPDVIFHCAADALADACEQRPLACHDVQVGGTHNVIELARECGARVFYPQSVFIFDGTELPVTETTTPAPLSVYGRCKLEAEQLLADALTDSLIVRMAGFFGGEARDKNFVGSFTRWLFGAIARGERQCEVGERIWQPTYTLDLARNVLLLLARGSSGVYHMGAHGEATFFEVATACVEELGLSHLMTIERRRSDATSGEVAPRPWRMVTANQRLEEEGLDRQRDWREALFEYLAGPYFRARAQELLERC